jgi:hypothetical protein
MTVSKSELSTTRRRFGGLLLIWGGLVALAATAGLTQAIPTVFVPLPIGVALALPLLLYARSERLQAMVAAEDLRWLTLFHAWRIPAGLTFLWYGAQGELPALFSTLAGWGDVAAGGLAIGAVLVLPRLRRGQRAGYLAVHAFGMIDFAMAVGTGFTFSVLGTPLMGAVQELPLVLIVFFGVPVTGALGLMTLHRLVRLPVEQRASSSVSPPA